MPQEKTRTVITSMGVISPLGSDIDSFWQAVLTGQCGLHDLVDYQLPDCPIKVVGSIRNFDPKQHIPASFKDLRKSLKVMARPIHLAMSATLQALEKPGIRPEQIDPFRFGVNFGCVMLATEPDDLTAASQTSYLPESQEVDLKRWGQNLSKIPPLWMLKYLPNMPACHVSVAYNAQGPNNSITTGDASGLLALIEAHRVIGRRAADFFLVGGCDSKLTPLNFARFALFDELTRQQDPRQAVRPFDLQRDGSALAEGAASLTLESLDFARQRKVPVLAEIVGVASGMDRTFEGKIFAQVIQRALDDAGIAADMIDHINAASGGWRKLDCWEARAISQVFSQNTPVFSLKALTGNTGSASGLIELLASLLALQEKVIPQSYNCHELDPECPIMVLRHQPGTQRTPWALKLSFTDRGQCAAVVIKKWTEDD